MTKQTKLILIGISAVIVLTILTAPRVRADGGFALIVSSPENRLRTTVFNSSSGRGSEGGTFSSITMYRKRTPLRTFGSLVVPRFYQLKGDGSSGTNKTMVANPVLGTTRPAIVLNALQRMRSRAKAAIPERASPRYTVEYRLSNARDRNKLINHLANHPNHKLDRTTLSMMTTAQLWTLHDFEHENEASTFLIRQEMKNPPATTTTITAYSEPQVKKVTYSQPVNPPVYSTPVLNQNCVGDT